ncbi:MAG: hypothetical protein ACR2MG_05120 [Pyrinomonadaceae bacterium]
MQKQKYYRLTIFLTMLVIFQAAFGFSVKAQESKAKPELSVAGIELGNREKAKTFLTPGYMPRKDEDGRPTYYFYNEWGSQVMKLTAASFEDPYFITEIEVFAVSEKYQERHFQAEDIKYFTTENGIFIGFKQSAMYFIAGIKNMGSKNKFELKDVIEVKGEPGGRIVKDEKRNVITYNLSNIKLPGENLVAGYQASYEFYKKSLSRFSIKLIMDESKSQNK